MRKFRLIRKIDVRETYEFEATNLAAACLLADAEKMGDPVSTENIWTDDLDIYEIKPAKPSRARILGRKKAG